MAELYGAGQAIYGEKILFCFGGYTRPNDKDGKRVGTLKKRGWAGVERPVRRSTSGAPLALDELSCELAKYSCNEFRVDDKRKIEIKNHTGYQGFLEGDASCTIQVPHRNIPQK